MIYKIFSDEQSQLQIYSLLDSLERGFNSLGIDFYLVGAIARDTWFGQKGIKPLGTKDVDLAISIPYKDGFENLKEYLCKNEGFTSSSTNPYVLFNKDRIQVDLLPFGEIEVEGKVMIAGNGRTKISINGFREVYECGTGVVKYDNGKTFKVCTLPGIAILKLIAYDDRPEIRQKDIQDLSLILKHYFELETEIIYDLHHDLFDDTSENKLIAARVLGRQMKLILKRSSELERRIVGVLKAEIENPEKSKIAELMVVGTENTIYDAIDLMKELLRGIEEF